MNESIKPTVLFVDDEEYNLLVFKSSFRRYFEVITAPSAIEAMQLLKDNPVDMIISDQRMPDMSGVEFLNSLPEEPETIKMILTGYSDMEAVIDAINQGKISRFISKPWQKAELQKIMDEAFEKKLHRKKEKALGLEELQNQLDLVVSDKDDLSIQNKLQSLKKENEELKNQVLDSYKNLHLLSEIGQEITSTLNLDTILNTVYESVNSLMDASIFGIGIYHSDEEKIEYRLAIEKGKRYQPYSRTMEDKNQFPVWCIENKKEIFINDVFNEYDKYISKYKDNEIKDNEIKLVLEDGTKSLDPLSYIYLPLMVNDKVIGIVTVQSFTKNAYTKYHLTVFKNISLFVSTALENAKAYKLIGEQKTEIEQKNVELEHKVQKRTEQLQQKNNEVLKQRDELESTYRNVKLLSEIGKDITSTLNLDTILNTVYENVNRLMDASVFGIGIYHATSNVIEYRLAIENGLRYQPYSRTMEDKNQFPVWCVENKKEVFINDVFNEYSNYINNFNKESETAPTLEDGTKAEVPVSLIYLPLMMNEMVIGLITVQSFRKFAYNKYHLDILSTLASYISIAVQNSHSYNKMTEAFEELKSAQTKLVESEKMASLGVLTAGVAHEINNPVNFISGGIESLQENYSDLQGLQSLLLTYHSQKGDDSLWTLIEERKNELQLNKLLPEIDELMDSIRSGADRTAEIVRGLRNFSRLDEHDMKKANLEEGIDNTLVILNNRLKNKVKVNKEYGNIPPIFCYPGQLNQVFMNIIYNAADAITEKGEITLKTWLDNNQVNVSVADNGTGMPEDVCAHIFEPFYTTKPVGKGTGLGLSIAYGIIEKHKGKIHVESTLGVGTTFYISIPFDK